MSRIMMLVYRNLIVTGTKGFDTQYWDFVSVKTEDGYQRAIYSYGSMTSLGTDETTADYAPFTSATFGNIRGGESDQELTLAIKAYAVTDAGFS